MALCRVLWDPDGVLGPLKRRCDPYPAALGEALIKSFFWEARFALENAAHGRGKDDPAYVAGCAFRSIACLCQALFALNRVYLLNEKGTVSGVERLALKPADFAGRVKRALAGGASGLPALMTLVEEIAALLKA